MPISPAFSCRSGGGAKPTFSTGALAVALVGGGCCASVMTVSTLVVSGLSGALRFGVALVFPLTIFALTFVALHTRCVIEQLAKYR